MRFQLFRGWYMRSIPRVHKYINCMIYVTGAIEFRTVQAEWFFIIYLQDRTMHINTSFAYIIFIIHTYTYIMFIITIRVVEFRMPYLLLPYRNYIAWYEIFCAGTRTLHSCDLCNVQKYLMHSKALLWLQTPHFYHQRTESAIVWEIIIWDFMWVKYKRPCKYSLWNSKKTPHGRDTGCCRTVPYRAHIA